MRLPRPRGPLSTAVRTALAGSDASTLPGDVSEALAAVADPLGDDDLQLALWVLYELHYRGFDDVADDLEWDPDLLRARRQLEVPFEAALRELAHEPVSSALAAADEVVEQIEHVIASVEGTDLTRVVQRTASREQVLELMAQRSVYTLKESDPSSFVLPRLDAGVKTALAEVQYDEYGAGRPERLHATLFARGLEACGLDSSYGGYVEDVPGHVLCSNNVMSLLGLHRRLRGAALGHLAAFEATSSVPSRRIAAGVRRVGLAEELWAYFDEHVEADAVHEQVALRDICGGAVTAEPALREDVLLGAALCQLVEARSSRVTLADWAAGRSSLRAASARLQRVPA